MSSEYAINQSAVIREFGNAGDVVTLAPCTPGPLAADHVRVRMRACSINPSDLLTIAGTYRSRTTLPFHPGYEGVGVVERVGAAVSTLRAGDRVMPIGSAGCWQTYKDCEADWCLAVADALTDEQAAMSYVNPMTAWAMLHDVAGIKPGMRIAITAAGSSIGRIMIRLAARAGVTPIALVRSDRAAARIAKLSATPVICRSAGEQAAAINRIVATDGPVDAVFDCVGGPEAMALSRLLRRNGQFVHYGLLSGTPIPPTFHAARPDIRMSLFHLRQWVREVPLHRVHATHTRVAQLMAEGVIDTTVRSHYRLAHIQNALADAGQLASTGKVIITI